MDLTTRTAGTLSVDWSGLRSSRTRAQVERVFEGLGAPYSANDDLWGQIVAGRPSHFPERFLVVTDLATCARSFRESDVRLWASAVRMARPYILAFIRNKLDQQYADLVDDIVQASENRVSVCSLISEGPEAIDEYVSRAVFSTDPDAILEVRFSPDNESLWLCFGDGYKATLTWGDLGLPDLDPPLVPSTASVSEDHNSVEVLRENGSVFDIDSAALRGMVDNTAAESLRAMASRSNQELGRFLQGKRKSKGLTQVEVSQRSGLEQSLISKLENGRHGPRFDTLNRYAGALGLTVSELLGP